MKYCMPVGIMLGTMTDFVEASHGLQFVGVVLSYCGQFRTHVAKRIVISSWSLIEVAWPTDMYYVLLHVVHAN